MAKVRRIYDAKTLNKIVNRPDIIAMLAPDYSSLEMGPFFKRKGNVALKHGRATMLFAQRRKGLYEAHFLIPAEMRGREGLHAARAMMGYVFTSLNARAIVYKVPEQHMPSRIFCRALGGETTGPCKDAAGTDCIGYIMERDKWAM